MEHDVDLLIVGAGPAGLYAAYYAGFRALSVVDRRLAHRAGRAAGGALPGEGDLRRRRDPGDSRPRACGRSVPAGADL